MYDLIVIGGGINGCGIARDAAMRGLKVLLVEKNDFAVAASGNNSSMIHGGARYLLSDVATTQLSCLDSGYIQKIAKHLIFRIPFIFPVLKGPRQSAFFRKMHLELTETFFEAYDRYVPLKNGKTHTRLSREEALTLEPELSPETMGAISFDEWGIDSPRLTLLNALSAHEHGADIRNHSEVQDLLIVQGRVVGVRIKDLLTGELSDQRGKLTLNAAGPWTPKIAKMAGAEIKLRPAKGIHLTLDRRITNTAIMANAIDGRAIFLMPYQNVTIIGTTDDDYFGDPEHIEITEDEVEYLLEGIESVYPNIRQVRILNAWAGIRPTLYEREKDEDDLTREHEIFDHETRDQIPGLLSIAGGKLASYRIMSQEAVDLVCKKLGIEALCTTHLQALPGSEEEISIESLAEEFQIPLFAASRLVYRHGCRARKVLEVFKNLFSSQNIACECETILEAELRYAIRYEWARTLDDLRRRTRFTLGPCQGSACLMRGTQILGEELGLSPKQIFARAQEFLEIKWRSRRPVLRGTQLQQEELNQAVFFGIGCLDQFLHCRSEIK